MAVQELMPEEFDERFAPIFLHVAAETGDPWRYNPAHFHPVWQHWMRLGLARAWAGKDCILGALFSHDTFSGEKCGYVHFWHSLPSARGTGAPIRLFKAFEQAAREEGCKRCFSMAHEALNPSNLRAVYPRLGYKQHETIFSKEL